MIIIGALTLLQSITVCQVAPLKFQTYTTESGLLHNFTRKAIEDRNGFIWIVSEIGLSRFDGVRFTNFQHDDADSTSLPHNAIHDIAVDAENRIWLATDAGLCYYNSITHRFVKVTPDKNTLSKTIALCFDAKRNTIWYIDAQGLHGLNAKTFSITTTAYRTETLTAVNQLYLSSTDQLWIARDRHGFVIYDIGKNVSTEHMLQNWVTCFYEDNHNTMWIGHWQSDHLVAWDMQTGHNQSYRDQDDNGYDRLMIMSGITSTHQLGDSLLLLSTQHLGIRVFNTHSRKYEGGYSRDMFVKSSLPSDFTNSIFTDRQGIVWVCTWNGLCKMNLQEQQFRTVELPFLNTPMFPLYNLVEGIAPADDGNWWLGVNGCGLIHYDPNTKQINRQHFCTLAPYITYTSGAWTEFVTQSSNGDVWAGNETGLVRIRGSALQSYPISINGVAQWKKTITIAQDQTFWIGTQQHVVHFYPSTGKYDVIEVDSTITAFPIRSVMETALTNDGTLWIATVGGLYKLLPGAKQCTRIPLNETEHAIHCIATDGKDKLYLGTTSGLGVYTISSGTFVLKGQKDNVHPIMWKSMLRDKAGNIWIYTTHSLFKYNPVQDNFTRFTTADGIHTFSSDPAHLFSFGSNFYIGYRGAFTEFDPLQVNQNQRLIDPQFASVKVGDTLLTIRTDSFARTPFIMRNGVNDIAFDFTGIDYTNSDKITFRYRMKEDSLWQETSNRSASFNNLEPGNHVFQLQARNSAGILNTNPLEFSMYVTPTLTQRWWFWPAVMVMISAGILLLARRRIQRIRREEALKTETRTMMAQLETRLLRSQMNPHFIFNSLNSIQKYIWESRQEDAAEYLASFAKLIRAILDNSRREVISLAQELEIMKLYIQLEQRRCNCRFDYHVQVEPEIPLEAVMVPPLLIQPYIENAIWHGVAKKKTQGHIGVTIFKQGDQLVLEIEDDGVGREVTKHHPDDKQSAGMEITQERIERLDTAASVHVIDKKENGMPTGTKVIVTIPYQTERHAQVLHS